MIPTEVDGVCSEHKLLRSQGYPVLTGSCQDGADVREMCLQVGVMIMYEAFVDDFHEIRQSSKGSVGSLIEFIACRNQPLRVAKVPIAAVWRDECRRLLGRLSEGTYQLAMTGVELGEILRRINASDDLTCSLHRMRRAFHLVIEFLEIHCDGLLTSTFLVYDDDRMAPTAGFRHWLDYVVGHHFVQLSLDLV